MTKNKLSKFNPYTQAHPSEILALITQHEDIIAQAERCFIDTLPFEILSDIFCRSLRLFWELDGFHEYVGCLSLASPPLSLISVCKVWRDVALATPSLWDSILPSYNSFPCIKTWMKVSPNLPFHLKLMPTHREFLQVNPRYNYELFRLFSTVSHRWKSLSIRLTARVAEELLNFLQANTGNPMPIKDVYISLEWSDLTPENTMRGILSLLSVSTSVERLYWDGGWSTLSTALHIPWKQLRTVTVRVGKGTTQGVVNILSQCTSASAVSIIVMSSTNPEYHQTLTPRRNPFLLPILTSLKLSRQIDPMVLLQYFTFPSLRYLWIEVAHRSLSTLADFLERTPELEDLTIDESGPERQDSPDGPAEQDIIDYLGIPELRNIPSFRLTFRDAHTLTVSIIEENPAKLNVPSLLCWRVSCSRLRYPHCSFIGWTAQGLIKDIIWECRQGKLEFTPEYYSKWYNWRDPSWNQPGGTYLREPPSKRVPFKALQVHSSA